MLIKVPPSWQLPEKEATPEDVFRKRRQLLKTMGLGGGLLAVSSLIGVTPASAGLLSSAPVSPEDYPKSLEGLPPLPAITKNKAFQNAGRPLSEEYLAGSFNNFYEFTSDKDEVFYKSRDFKPRPWTVEVTGLVNNPKTWDIDQLIKAFPLEERIYRFRCVEAWAMTVPWVGFPLANLLKQADPKSEAKFVRFVSLEDSNQFPAQKWRIFAKWPYREGLRLDETMNELALLTVGVYGHSLPAQHGAPLRLITPWKYGFKSAKSIVKIELVKEQPATFWNDAAPTEYGFYSNINPDVPHPRWSQKTERLLGGEGRRPTLIYNGYGEQVAHLYKDLVQPRNGPPI